jgi:putative iron-only hydrogenase system regulator
MDTRIAIIGIIIDDVDITSEVNQILHDYSMYILGRMGIPYREKDLNIISIAIDAPADIINQLAGKLGKLNGVSAKTMYSKLPTEK